MAKRLALVVDDSSTARVTLKRMLEQHNLEVDTLESAPEALDYLVNRTPDVIFMDHMMPDMDGFEAVEAIKGNPDTATIPIMMYTSKEGDLYVSQARALGAIGILPKHVEPAELFEVLNSLGLAKERRAAKPERSGVVLLEDAPELALSAARDDIRDIADEAADAVSGHHDQPGQLVGLLENYYHEMTGQVRALRTEIGRLAERQDMRARSSGLLLPLVVFLVMLLPLLWLYGQQQQTVEALDAAQRNADALAGPALHAATLEAPDRDNDVTSREAARRQHERMQQLFNSIAWAVNFSGPYGIDEEAFNDRRLAIVQELLTRLSALGFRGTVQLESHLGEFCLTGDDVDGYSTAPDDLPATECSLIGHPLQELPTLGERQSIGFANFIATSPLLAGGDIRLEISSYRHSRPKLVYPPHDPGVTAGEWNRIAAANNRVEVTLVPGG